jgi:hypothetical protein
MRVIDGKSIGVVNAMRGDRFALGSSGTRKNER